MSIHDFMNNPFLNTGGEVVMGANNRINLREASYF